MATFSSSGLFEQDDSEPWQSMARTARSAFARKIGLSLNLQMGASIGEGGFVEDWPGPGLVSSTRYEEGAHRVIHERWLDYVSNAAYPPPRPAPTPSNERMFRLAEL